MRSRPEGIEPGLRISSVKPDPVPPKIAAISDCSVTTDSVVATATVKVAGTMRRIEVQWGDGTVDTLRNTPGTQAPAAGQNALPAGTYRLTHAYAEPDDGKAFQQYVLIRALDDAGGLDFCLTPITVTPRYRVTNYRTRLTPGDGCDSGPESQSEFEALLYVDGDAVQYWRWNALEPGFTGLIGWDWHVLEGSMVSRELTMDDQALSVFLNVVELDPIWDDVMSSIGQNLHPSYQSLTVQGSVSGGGVSGTGCTVHYVYDREVTLIVPLPPSGQQIVVMG